MVDRVISAEDVIYYIIESSQRQFTQEEQKRYIKATRLNKLITLTARDLEMRDIEIDGFVWGYYKHGFFSPTTRNFLINNYGRDFYLYDLKTPSISITSPIADYIDDYISTTKNFFVKSREKFYKWVYENKTPSKYKNFYLNNLKLEQWFLNMKNDLLSDSIQNNLFGKKGYAIDDLISEYYFSLRHIDDLESFAIFRKFTDLVEMLILKLNNGAKETDISKELDKLFKVYREDIYPILTPYLDTLKGDEKLVEKEHQEFTERIDLFKISANFKIELIYRHLEKEDLLPSFGEMREEISLLAKQLPSDSKSLQETYNEINNIHSQ